MATIPPRFLEEIRARVSVSSVVGQRVRLTRAGREHKACCPFHHEKTPSFTVNDDKGFYHCFGCGAHGDVIRFLMDHDKMPFPDAVASLAALAGLEVPKPTPQEARRARREKTLHDVMEAAAAFFEAQLTGAARDYIAGRGLDAETLKAFRVGFAPADGAAMPAALRAQGFTDAQMAEVGLTRPSKRGGSPYAFFRERIMFPVTDRRGRPVAFGGRVLPEALRAPQMGDFEPPKYLNSPDTPLFDKSSTLYAGAEARAGAAAGATPLVVEGYMDAIACHAAGIRGAVAPMGTALTQAQLSLVWAMAEPDAPPVLCFDGDAAGQRAAARAIERALPLLAPDRTLRIAFLPQGTDPDSLIRASGPGALKKVLRGAQSIVDTLWVAETAGRALDTPEARAGVKARLLRAVETITDADVAAHYRSAIHERVGQAFFPKREKRGARRAGGQQARQQGPRPVPARPAGAMEGQVLRGLVAAVVNHPHIYARVDETLGRLPLPDPELAALRGAVIAALEDDPALEAPALGKILRDQGHAKLMDDIAGASVYLHARFAAPDADPSAVAASWHAQWAEVQRRAEAGQNHERWRAALASGDLEAEAALRETVMGEQD